MQRSLVGVLTLVACVMYSTEVNAQSIKVVKKPAPQAGPDDTVVYDTWVMSWGLRDDAGYPLGFRTFSDLGSAQAAAQNAISSTSGNGEWAITHVLIEGEASVRSKKGPSLPSDDKIEKDAIGSLKDDVQKTLKKILKEDVAGLFKKRNQEVKDSYRRAKEAKELLIRNVSKIADDDFTKVNGLISQYNGLKDKYASGEVSPQYFAALPRMTSVSADDVKRQQEKWKKSQDSADDLNGEKKALDEERARLEKERQDLIDDGRSLDAQDDQITALQSASPDGGPLSGPFKLKTGQFSNTSGSDAGSFDSFLDAREAGRRHMSDNRSKQPNYHIIDSGGDEIEYDGLFGRKTVSQGRIDAQKNSNPENSPENLSKRRSAVAEKRRDRSSKVAKYRSDLEAYKMRLAAYAQKLAAHKSQLNDWKQDQYVISANTSPIVGR